MKGRRIAYRITNESAEEGAISYLLDSLGIRSRVLNLATMLNALPDIEPGCVFLDVDNAGVDFAALLAATAPRRGDLPVVLLSARPDLERAITAMRLGARDYLAKPIRHAELAGSMTRIFEQLRDQWTVYEQRREAYVRVSSLSDRESEVLNGLVAGRSNKQQAYALGVSIRTIEMHRANMMAKLGVQNLAAAIRLAFVADVQLELGSRPDSTGYSISRERTEGVAPVPTVQPKMRLATASIANPTWTSPIQM